MSSSGVKIPKFQSKGNKASAKKSSQKEKKTTSWSKSLFEFLFFVGWIICTGFGGYFVGHTPSTLVCPPAPEPEIVQKKVDCIYEKLGAGVSAGAVVKEGGYTIDELSKLWKCSQAELNVSHANKKLFPKEKNLDRTKWKSIISVEPKAFFEKYLSQYPGDTRAVQPVIVFSHKPLSNFEEIPEVCKVIDVAVVPDTPGVCVAVTETFHDVASYHMLHADRQPDGSFALTANSIEGRVLPDERAYAQGRGLLLDYFSNVDYVAKAVKTCPRFGQGRVVVGVLIEDLDEFALFKNSLASALKEGVSKSKFCGFTTDSAVAEAVKKTGLPLVYLPNLKTVGSQGGADVAVEPQMRRYFLQAWLAFAVANSNNKMMWQSPGTIWFDRPDNIVNIAPVVETLWSFKGRNDKRAAPFFVSFDFFVPTSHERPVHLMHEIMLHFDLVLAWKSLDAVVSYRLSENNARYGTTTYIMPPYKVLHADLMNRDAEKIREASMSEEKPMAIVFPHEGMSATQTKELIQKCGLWYTDE